MKLITEEKNRANDLRFSETAVDGYSDKIVEISVDNAAKAEFVMSNDLTYIRSGNINAEPKKNGYKGSEAYWIAQLKKILFNDSYTKYQYNEIIENIVGSIDRENSTHLNADGCGRKEITDRIIDFGQEKIISCLENGTLDLYNKIIEETHPDDNPDKNYKPRINRSFASKFCHFVCFYMFSDTEAQDNYSIYDEIVRKALPLYLKYYNLNNWVDYKEYNKIYTDLSDYGFYRESVDKIIDASNVRMSRNAFDHLLWCYYKGRVVTRDKFSKKA